jgi:DNA-binding SARP family transcriptional activator
VGEEWSPGREKNLHSQVSALRRRLEQAEPGGGGRLARSGAGYRLVLGPGELDVAVFRDLAGRGRETARAGDAAAARELLGQALGVWRGAALADAAPLCSRLAGEAARLEEARAAAVEERVECDLALGRHAEVVGELAGLVAQFPLRERLAALLMTALYRCGRRGEALAVYDTARRVLAEELGLDPGLALAGLQAQVLADDPALAAPVLAPLCAGAGVVPRQLPAGVGFFAGREAELKQLDELLDQAGLPTGANGNGGPGGAVVISAVAGMAGVGKTALAVHWAHRVAARFPDGQLYVNLRGYEPGVAVTADEATGWFLAALATPPTTWGHAGAIATRCWHWTGAPTPCWATRAPTQAGTWWSAIRCSTTTAPGWHPTRSTTATRRRRKTAAALAALPCPAWSSSTT